MQQKYFNIWNEGEKRREAQSTSQQQKHLEALPTSHTPPLLYPMINDPPHPLNPSPADLVYCAQSSDSDQALSINCLVGSGAENTLASLLRGETVSMINTNNEAGRMIA